MYFLDDIGPGFEPGKNGIDVNPVIIVGIVVVVVAAIIITAVLIKKRNKK